MKKVKFKMEYLIYLFILLTPFFDAISFLFRKYVPDAVISPSTILRPIIPIILLIYIFIKDSASRKVFIVGGTFYGIYGIIHLLIFNKLHTEFNAGSMFSETQYLLNYTYMIGLFYAFSWFQKNRGLPKLRKSITLMLAIYLGLIYLSIITGTSSTTYLDGVGYKGWNASGNGLSAVFILGFCAIFTYLLNKIKRKYVWFFLLGLFYYLLILFGTRTAFFGSILVVLAYGFSRFLLYLIQDKEVNVKQFLLLGILVVFIGIISFVGGTNVLKRRQNMSKLENTIVDPLTNETSHLTGDLTAFVVEIKQNNESVYMSDEQKLALLRTYKTATKRNIPNSNRRLQQLIYHHYLFLEECSFETLFFGNGYLNNYPELTLEMELPSFFYNFGLCGFLLYFGPFLYLTIKMMIDFFRKVKTVTVDYMMYLFGAMLSIVLSFLTGYVYFYVSSMLVVICIFILLAKEREVL